MAQSMMTATATTGWKRRRHDDQFSSNNHNSLPSARTMFVSISVLSFLLLTIPNGYHAAPISSSVSSSILSASSLYYSNLFHSPFLLSMISSSMNKVGANNNSNDSSKSATAASSITFTTSLPNLPPVGSSSSLTALTTTTIDQQQPIIEDALCRIEDLEQANDSQLYTILHELVQTTFFRTFLVNLNRKCPLQSWNMDKKQKQDPDLLLDQQSQIDVIDLDSNDEEEYQCDGGGAAEELDEDAEPLCTVAHEDDNMDNNNFLTSPFQKKEPSSSKHQQQSNPFESNALFSLSQGGYESKSQQDAFSWEDVTDQVEDDDDDENTNSGRRLLPDTFWNDMCRNLQVDVTPDDYSVNTNNGKSNVVNLLLNPEHNTGYNGTHIWRAIYEENCITKNDGDDSHMCLEERVLYRLLSGLHTSTTISIAMHYYPPSKRKNRHTWEPNPTYFMSKFEHNTEYIRNLHFSYAVLLRALHKASPFLYEYSSKLTNIYTSNTVDDETASILLRRLLDSSILKSCSNVFTAFDESLMFQEEQTAADENFSKDIMDVVSLQKNFKGVFHNVSSILDCVQCQQCKLHGKMAMLGYGTALKILFMDNHPPLLDRNEIVALINTIAKFSESIRNVRKLTQLYWMTQYEQQQLLVVQQQQLHSRTQPKQQQSQQTPNSSPSNSFIPVVAPTTALPSKTATASGATTYVGYKEDNSRMPINYVDTAIGLISSLGRADLIPVDREGELIQLALQRQPELLLLAKHYADDMNKFLKFSSSIPLPTVPVEPVVSSSVITPAIQDEQPDAIVIGSGLAGMAATLNILDRGGRVILLEKEHLLGGNSNKASSGINACCPNGTSSPTDSMTVFENDTIKSAGESARPDLISTLISNSGRAVEWLRTRVGVDLSLTSQLGGHTDKRTHRPNNGMVGAEIIYGMQKAVKAYEKLGQVKIIMKAKVTKLVTTDDGARVIGVQYVKTDAADDKQLELNAPNVILATGGFAADRSKGSYLDHYRPELVRMPTTAGTFSTGDGVTLATSLGAGVVDMDKVQVHPTGWVDPSDPENTSKTLAAELMRGVGGILLNDKGKRFCNELGTRSYVTEKMLSHNEQFVKIGKWNVESPIPTFSMILSSSAAADGAKKHVDLYTRKGLMTRLEGVAALAQWMGIPKSAVVSSLKEYQNDATTGKDSFGKTSFRNIPAKDLDNEIFYAGTVTPVLHYCMGGITIDTEGNVLNGETGDIIHGLHAAGEVTGGVHGVNRLAGNSLLECTVFGTIVGQKIPIHTPPMDTSNNSNDASTHTKSDGKLRSISMSELQRHNTPEDCWVAIHGVVYDLTLFADEHPAGSESIHELAGTDGTDAFDAVHNKGILDDFDEDRVGLLI